MTTGSGEVRQTDWDPQRFIDHLATGWQLGDAESFVTHFHSVIHPDVTSYQPLLTAKNGRDAVEEEFRLIFMLLPGVKAKIRSWSATEPNVFVEFRLSVPTNEGSFVLDTCDRFTLSEGLIVDRRVYFDPRELLDVVAEESASRANHQ